MRILSQLLILLLLTIPAFSQDNVSDTITSKYSYDFSEIWMEPVYQGIIGSDNQRIQIKFLKIYKDSTYSNIYMIEGKSIVHDNICDFFGILRITNIIERSGEDAYSTIEGVYTLGENPDQKHVGTFKGKFITKYRVEGKKAVAYNDEYSNEGCSEFTGEWTEYDKTEPKICNWGRQIPPTGESVLFEHCSDGKYEFTMKYLDNGWKSYVIANIKTFIQGPDELVNKYKKEDIAKYTKLESREWWKD